MTRKGDAAMRVLFIANKHNAKTVDALFQIAAYCDMQGIEHIELDVSQLPDSSFVYGPAQLADIDEALLKILYDTLVYLNSTGNTVDPMTQKTYDYYKRLDEESNIYD